MQALFFSNTQVTTIAEKPGNTQLTLIAEKVSDY